MIINRQFKGNIPNNWHSCACACSWASYQILKTVGCACAGNAGSVFPATDFKGNCQIATPACITARTSRTCRDACRERWPVVAEKTFPVFPAQPAILRNWQEVHGVVLGANRFAGAVLSTFGSCKYSHDWCIMISSCLHNAFWTTNRCFKQYQTWFSNLVVNVVCNLTLFCHIMMTSSNGNIFRVTGPLCGFTDPRWIPRAMASDAEL